VSEAYTRAEFPQYGALTQSKWGEPYAALETSDREEAFRAAIDWDRSALEVYTRAELPRYRPVVGVHGPRVTAVLKRTRCGNI
jgi:hypothetical protein